MNCIACDREVFAKKMCKKHYQQIRSHGKILTKEEERERKNKPEKCSEEGCEELNFSKGYCQKHYMRKYREEKSSSEKSKKENDRIFYLIVDLERSLLSGGRIYWKANRRGYTPDPKHAGIYNQEEAVEIALNDQEGLTALLVLDEQFKKIIYNNTINAYEND